MTDEKLQSKEDNKENNSIVSTMQESRTFPPSETFSSKAHIKSFRRI
mgnify:CR=1 FL=1